MFKRNKIIFLLTLFIVTVALGATISEDRLSIGQWATTTDREIIFNTGDGSSNKKLTLEYSSKNLLSNSNVFVLGDGADTNKSLTMDLGLGASNPVIRYNATTDAFEFANDGASFSEFGSGGGGGGGVDSLQYLLDNGEVIGSAYASGLSISEGASSTVEGYFPAQQASISLQGVAEFDTNLVLQVSSLASGSVVTADSRDRSTDFDSGDVVQIFRLYQVDGVDTYIDTGIEKTLTGNSTFSSNETTVFIDETNVLVDDVLYKKDQITKEVSLAILGAADSFSAMTKTSVQVTDFVGGALGDAVSFWDLQQTTGTLTDLLAGEDLVITGTLSQAAGKNLPNSLTGFDGSNYINTGGGNGKYGNLPGDEVDFSFTFWYYTGNSLASNDLIWALGPTGNAVGDGDLLAVYTDSGPVMRLQFSGAGAATTAIVVNTWYFIVVTHDASTNVSEFHVNASSVGTSTGDLNPITGGVALAGAGDGTDGVASDARFESMQHYAKILSGAEITELYNSGNGLVGTDRFSVIEKYEKTGETGQILKSRVQVPSLSANADLTVSKHGAIK